MTTRGSTPKADPVAADRTLTDQQRAVAAAVIEALAGTGARLRPDQEDAVARVLESASRLLLVQATGWGKSAVYWAATAIRRAAGSGPTLVVSPLLALMRDQVGAAQRAGLRAATINSANIGDWSAIEAALAADELDVLLVSPERLASPGFGTRVLDALAGRLGLLVIDEAHAISDWGHDFRPDYRRVSDVLRRVNPATPVLATTATANARVAQDVAVQLGEQTHVSRGTLARDSLELTVLPELDALARYAWVVDHLPTLPGSGIVYVLTVADAGRLTEAIRAVHGPSVPVAAYTGALEGQERIELEEALRDNRLKALVATSALGMGYDKPDLGFVVHVGSPPSPVSYYQQVGRAGRAIDHALVALLPSAGDDRIWEYFATATLPDPDQVRRLLAALPGPESAPSSVPALEAETGLRRTRVELLLKQLAVDEVVERLVDGWRATGRTWTYDAEHYAGILATRRREAAIMRAYVEGGSCLMELLQQVLDDPAAGPCGRCSVCRGGLPAGLADQPQADTVAAVRGRLREDTQVLEPRKMWPGGSFGAKGRIPVDLMAEPGRVLVHADAPEWAEARAGCLAVDGPPPPDLLAASVAALAAWRTTWAARPEVVVPLAAEGLTSLVCGVAAHLAEVGRLALTSPWAPTQTPPGRDAASAEEASYWRACLQPSAGLSVDVAGRAVLLVIDATATGWSATVAAAALREVGAACVLPLVIHRRV